MSRLRYEVEQETVGKWFIEQVVEMAGLETDEAIRVTITDHATGRDAEGVGSDYDEAVERACRRLGIRERDLDEELDD